MVILDIDMGYLVTLMARAHPLGGVMDGEGPGLVGRGLVHGSRGVGPAGY